MTGASQSDRWARSPNKILENSCLDAVHLPLHPSDCLKVPEPLRPESRPTLVAVTPLELLIALTAPLGLTRPLTPWPMILPLVTTTAFRLLPEQVVPTLLTTHAPSKLPAAPPCEARRGSSASGLLRRAGLSGSLRAAAHANRRAIFHHCRYCRRHCRTAHAQDPMRPRSISRGKHPGWSGGRQFA